MTTAPMPLMAVPEEPAQTPRWMLRLGRAARAASGMAGAVLGASSRASLSHVREHFYAMAGFGAFCAAGFLHSVFVGCLVTGASFLVFEFKIAEGEETE